MAKFEAKPTIQLTLTMEVSEEEARALDAMAGYGDDPFIKVFYEHLGAAYMRDHERGLRDFLRSVRELVPSQLRRVDDARKAFTGEKP